MVWQRILEISVYGPSDAVKAVHAGADRLELCAGIGTGGLSPSDGMIRMVREVVDVPLHIIARPREGGFVYNELEFPVLLKDIEHLQKIGVDGIATGVLTQDGQVDIPRMQMIIEKAFPVDITFHRAFDYGSDQDQMLEDLIQIGVKRVLTSGGAPSAEEGAENIRNLVEQAAGRIIIMPGGGVRSKNLKKLAAQTGALEFHSSALMPVISEDSLQKKNISLASGNLDSGMQMMQTDEKEIAEMKKILEMI